MLTCRQLTELVTDYLEGALPFGQRVRFQLHVGMCRHCRAYLRQVRAVRAATQAMTSEAPPPEVMAELLRRFRTWPFSRNNH